MTYNPDAVTALIAVIRRYLDRMPAFVANAIMERLRDLEGEPAE